MCEHPVTTFFIKGAATATAIMASREETREQEETETRETERPGGSIVGRGPVCRVQQKGKKRFSGCTALQRKERG